MDDRKKRISELEKRKREQTVLLDALLIRLGESLFERMDDADSLSEDLSQYRRLQDDIAASHDSIQAVEEQLLKCKELDENIAAKEREDSACSKEQVFAYSRLGKLLLDSSDDEFCAPYRAQAEALLTKIQSLEDRLIGLEQQDNGNVFAWIGKSAQVLVQRSFLAKAQENLEQLYRSMGDRYSRRNAGALADSETQDGVSLSGLPMEATGIQELCTVIEQKRAKSRVLSQELTTLKEERRAISGSLNADGGPRKYMQTMKNHISHVKEELKTLYKSAGAEAVCDDTAGEPSERRELIQSFIAPEDKSSLENAARISRIIHDDEIAIQKLQSSLAIDEENAKIEKCRKMIQDKKEKIAQAERSIADYERSILDSEEAIIKLQELL